MKNQVKNDKLTIKKEDFINFLANATPEEVSDYIRKKGKPRKLINPMIFFGEDDNPDKMK